MRLIASRCPNWDGCGEVITLEADGKQYEYDIRNSRVTSVEHHTKRCMELARCRKGLKPRPVSETTLDSF